jgi:hypothetical protein
MSASHFTEEDLAAAKRRRELEEKIDRDDRLTPAARTVGRELLRWVHRDVGYSWISAAKLAKKLSLGARTVARVLPVLERYGYFEGEHRPGQTTRYRAVYEVPTAPRTSAKMAEVTSAKMSDHLCQKRPNTSAKMAHKTLRENSNKNLSEVSPPPSAAAEAQTGRQRRKDDGRAFPITGQTGYVEVARAECRCPRAGNREASNRAGAMDCQAIEAHGIRGR